MRLTRREARAFTRLIERAVAPRPPLPDVADTDALDAVERWLTAAPRLNRNALRAALVAPRLPAGAAEALRAAAAASYYGDARVMRILGYDPSERP